MEVTLALLADGANVSREGKLNLFGIFDTLFARSFPTTHPQMQLVIRFEAAAEEANTTRQVEIQLVASDGGILFRLPGALTVQQRGLGDAIRMDHVLTLNHVQFEPLVVQIKANTGRQAAEVSADAGYCSEHNLRVAQQRHIRAYIATGRQRRGQASATNARRGRTSGLVAAMRQRLRRGGWRSRYRLRKGTVEPVFGIMKHVRGFRQFLLRGATKVAGEWSLVTTAHNLHKLAAAWA